VIAKRGHESYRDERRWTVEPVAGNWVVQAVAQATQIAAGELVHWLAEMWAKHGHLNPRLKFA